MNACISIQQDHHIDDVIIAHRGTLHIAAVADEATLHLGAMTWLPDLSTDFASIIFGNGCTQWQSSSIIGVMFHSLAFTKLLTPKNISTSAAMTAFPYTKLTKLTGLLYLGVSFWLK